jgi:hypothetical protein
MHWRARQAGRVHSLSPRHITTVVASSASDTPSTFSLPDTTPTSITASVNTLRYHEIHENFGKPANMHRAVLRLLNRAEFEVCPGAYLVAGNHHIMTGVYSWAAGCYFHAQQMAPDDAEVALCLGVAFVRMVMQVGSLSNFTCVRHVPLCSPPHAALTPLCTHLPWLASAPCTTSHCHSTTCDASDWVCSSIFESFAFAHLFSSHPSLPPPRTP